ncbi:MAG TPA: STAS domain-containing protein [Acidimicrobiia bacterium]|nr:STAS domain-containing protein [Acidimicrobiia bacterium]
MEVFDDDPRMRSDRREIRPLFLVDVISTEQLGIVRFAGELDSSTVARAEGRAREALERMTAQRLVIDMSEVTFCDSSGLTVLLRLNLAARAAGREVVIYRPRPQVRRIIEITDLQAVLTIED